jgi:MFS family permease
VINDSDKSALRLLLAIFFWFLGYTAIEAFFTLYAKNHLGLDEADGTRLLGQLSLIFVVFALPSGYIGAKFGRRVTIATGIVIMAATMLAMFLTPAATLNVALIKLPVLGVVPVLGVLLMIAGAGWALININSLPMVVDMTDAARIGTYTGLYYLFSTLSAIAGPNVNGWLITLTGNNYNAIMIVAPIFMAVALVLMLGVRRGEAVKWKSRPREILRSIPRGLSKITSIDPQPAKPPTSSPENLPNHCPTTSTRE